MSKEEISDSYPEDILRQVGESREIADELINAKYKDIQTKTDQLTECLFNRLKKGEKLMIYNQSGDEVHNYLLDFVRDELFNYLIKGENNKIKEFEQYLADVKQWLDRKDYDEG
jgi:predicted esterase YcpF (UPF0227 family)